MATSQYQQIYAHLRNVSILVTKRNEISSYLHVLDNETFDFFDSNRQHFDKLSAQAKAVRVEVKSAGTKKNQGPIWGKSKGNAVKELLVTVNGHVNEILNDIILVRSKIAAQINNMREKLTDVNMNEVILINTLPIHELIKDLIDLRDNYESVYNAIEGLIEQ